MTRLNSQSFQKNAEFFVIVAVKKSFIITSYDKQYITESAGIFNFSSCFISGCNEWKGVQLSNFKFHI